MSLFLVCSSMLNNGKDAQAVAVLFHMARQLENPASNHSIGTIVQCIVN